MAKKVSVIKTVNHKNIFCIKKVCEAEFLDLRIFGIKFPLVKIRSNTHLSPGSHIINGAMIANLQGVLLHFKYFNDFILRINEEIERGQHWNNAVQYNEYYNAFE
jgi:hypothetical protein